ncbi:ABC transporter substrate-binding protein [Cellulomonas humilata]|uniref:ABC-type nitrate/sulfonate/bicarbonate transport system substrate-binding protein n=1 Tax=Cellulomonas humilata TaxID=144055 RepID=A0ABU0EBU3_9CELL|nr:ABC transporter substrate-binding protein [Cellulomonas humilata]MDQ0372740.1 ABC-type nitrate/sulfonate/bicarbonate transport system substrate-binding protein [Cellulomonas humilata]
MSRRLASVAALLLVAALAAGCSSAAATTDPDGSVTLRYQGNAGQVTLPELADDLGYFEDVTLEWVGDTTSGPQDIQSAATGQTDFGGAFNGAIAKLVAAGSPITSVIGYYGSDDVAFNGYYVLEDSPVRSARDLVGKKVGMNTLGAHHEFVVREWLASEGLTSDEIASVQLVVVPPVSTEQALREGQIDVGTLGSVFRDSALERGGLRELFTDTSLYGEFTYGSYVFRDDVIAKNPQAVADFVQGVARAIRWTQTNPREVVIDRFETIIDGRGREENTDLVQYWKSAGVAGPGGVIDPKEISIWVDWLVREGTLEEGQIDPEDLYTNADNPYANGTYDPASGPDGEATS